jgi:LCP family protein required for cell wall assembly
VTDQRPDAGLFPDSGSIVDVDPQVGAPTSRRRRGVARHGKLHRPSPIARGLGIIAAVVAVALVSTVSVGAIATANVTRHIGSVSLGAADEDKAKHTDITAMEGGANILLLGSDTRVDQTAEPLDDEGARNDVTILIHISQDHSQVTAISFPRDTELPIPACTNPATGTTEPAQDEAMLNTSLGKGGPKGGVACAVKTIENLTGLSIPYAGLITFDGVIGMSDAVGGVDVCLTHSIHSGSFLNLEAGEHTLQGSQALAFLRVRYGLGDGSDLTRISNQQVFLSAMLRKISTENALSNPVTLYKFARAATTNMTLSDSLDNVSTLVSLASTLRHVSTSNMLLLQYPTVPDPEDTARVIVDPEPAHQLNVALQNDTHLSIGAGSLGASATTQGSSSATAPATTPATSGTSGSGTSGSGTTSSASATAGALPSSVTGQSADEQTCSKGGD